MITCDCSKWDNKHFYRHNKLFGLKGNETEKAHVIHETVDTKKYSLGIIRCSHPSISQTSKKYMMKLFFFILFLGISISVACPPNSPYEGMVPFFSQSQSYSTLIYQQRWAARPTSPRPLRRRARSSGTTWWWTPPLTAGTACLRPSLESWQESNTSLMSK